MSASSKAKSTEAIAPRGNQGIEFQDHATLVAIASVAGQGQGGRPALPVELRTVVATVRLTPSRKAKLQRLGAAWLGRKLDAAPEPS